MIDSANALEEQFIYSLNTEDAQLVAAEEYDIVLSEVELKQVEEKLGDYTDWYQALVFAIQKVKQNL